MVDLQRHSIIHFSIESPPPGPVGRFPNRTIGVNLRKNNRLCPRSGRFGFPTEPDFDRKLWILQTSLESRRDGIFVEKRYLANLSPVGGFWLGVSAASTKTCQKCRCYYESLDFKDVGYASLTLLWRGFCGVWSLCRFGWVTIKFFCSLKTLVRSNASLFFRPVQRNPMFLLGCFP